MSLTLREQETALEVIGQYPTIDPKEAMRRVEASARNDVKLDRDWPGALVPLRWNAYNATHAICGALATEALAAE